MPCSVSRGIGCSRPPVDQRPRRRADLPAGQSQLGQQRRHLGPAGDERLGADVDRLPAERSVRSTPPSRSAGSNRVIDACGPAVTQPVRRDKTRNPAADNAADVVWRMHQATTSVITPGSVAGSTPWPRLNTWPAAPASTARRPSSTTARTAAPPPASPRAAPPGRGCPAARCRADPAGGVGQRRSPVHADDGGPASDIAPSSSAVPTPKCVIGTPAPASASNTLELCGST